MICRILREASQFLSAGRELILQPQSEWFKVRHLLHDYGYHIEKEWFLKEDGKYYVVIKALPAADRQPEHYPDAFSYTYGACLLRERNPVLLTYLQKEMDKKKTILEQMTGIKNQSQKNPEQNAAKREQRQKQLEQEIREIRNYLAGSL